MACQSLPTKTYEIRQQAFTYRPASLLQDYREEYAYIQNRRQAVVNGTETTDDLPAPPVAEIPPNLNGDTPPPPDYFTPTPEEQAEGVDSIVRGVMRPR